MTAANESTATWASEELSTIASSDDLHVSPLREDGETYGTPTWIWSVVVDDSLYVRAYNGRQSRWYQAALTQKGGADHCRRHDQGRRIRAGRRSAPRPDRRGLSAQISRQSLSGADDWHPGSRRDDGNKAAGWTIKEMSLCVDLETQFSVTPSASCSW